MSAVQLRAYDGKPESIAVAEVPVPQPGSGEVLVRIFASPINPSDLMFIRGLYGFKKPLPAIPGFEGSGTVVEAGAGIMPRLLKGRRVGLCRRQPQSHRGHVGGIRGDLCAILHTIAQARRLGTRRSLAHQSDDCLGTDA